MTEKEKIERRQNSQRKYYEENKQKLKENSKEYYEQNKQILNKKYYQTLKEKHGVEKLRQIQSEYYLARCEREPAYRAHLREMALRRCHQKKLEGIPKKSTARPKGKPRKYAPFRTDAPTPSP